MGKTATKFVINSAITDIAEDAMLVVIEATPIGWIATIVIAAGLAVTMMAVDHGADKLWDLGYSYL